MTNILNYFKNKIDSLKKFLKSEFDNSDPSPPPLEKRDLDFMSDAKEALLAERTPGINILLYTIALLLLIALIWAKFAMIEEVTVGAGKVIPSTHVKSIQTLDGGILAELLVKEGQIVKPNQIIARLSVSDSESDYLAAKNHYLSLLATLARLEAESENKSTIEFPPQLNGEDELKNNEMELFHSRKKSLDERLQTLQGSLDIARKQFKIMQPLAAEGVVSKIELLQLQSTITTIDGNIKDEKNKFYREVLTDLDKTRDELKTVQEKIVGLQDRITRATVRSPVYGIVKQIDVTTIGGVLKPASELMQIVPLEDTLLIEARITPKDIAFIHPGQKATVKFTAYDYSIYGGLEGNVEYISADTVVDEKGETFYLVQVRTKRNYLGTPEKPLPIIPGMIATVDIVTGKKTISDYLLKPILKAKYEALRER